MSAYVIFDVEIFDLTRYQEFMAGVKPALEAAGGKYLESFYNGPVYQGLKSIRDECSRARLVAVQGL